jgi:hypothetical protein
MSSKGAVPKHQQQIKPAANQMKTTLDTALQVIDSCIKNGEEMLKSCALIEKSPPLNAVVKRIHEDTNAMVEMKEKILKLNRSVALGNQKTVKKDLQNMIEGMKNLSAEKIRMMSDVVSKVLCLTETSRVKKSFEANDKELLSMDQNLFPDAKLKQFTRTLRGRNSTVIKSLGQTESMLQELLQEMGMKIPATPQPSGSNKTQKLKTMTDLLIEGIDDEVDLPTYHQPQQQAETLPEIIGDLMSFFLNIPSVTVNDISMDATAQPPATFHQQDAYRAMAERFNRNLQEKVPPR